MAEKNIEMNIKNQENSYDILFPKTKQELVVDLLNDDTKVYIGLSEDATADDAFRKVFLSSVLTDKCAFKLVVRNNKNELLNKIPVYSDSFIDAYGNPVSGPLLTNEKGEINTFFKGGSIILKINTVADLSSWQETYEVINGKEYSYEINLNIENFKLYNTSQIIYFTDNVENIDICCLGGGGGGANGNGHVSYPGGGAGGGGYIQKKLSQAVNYYQDYQLIIGSGGNVSNDGGKTIFLDIEANGGKAGKQGTKNTIGYGGEGGGKGGNGDSNRYTVSNVKGQQNSETFFVSFTEENNNYGGGGGGGTEYLRGGQPNSGGGTSGGEGGYIARSDVGVSAKKGNNGGGGGGGGGYNGADVDYPSGVGAAGGNGLMSLRLHLKNI